MLNKLNILMVMGFFQYYRWQWNSSPLQFLTNVCHPNICCFDPAKQWCWDSMTQHLSAMRTISKWPLVWNVSRICFGVRKNCKHVSVIKYNGRSGWQSRQNTAKFPFSEQFPLTAWKPSDSSPLYTNAMACSYSRWLINSVSSFIKKIKKATHNHLFL